MKTINLRWMYPHYRHDEFVDVTDEVWAAMYQAKLSYSLLCRWFREAVLPQDKELETALFHRLNAKKCAVCVVLFTPGSNRAKYCPECAVQVRRRKEAERQRKRYYLSTHLGAENPL